MNKHLSNNTLRDYTSGKLAHNEVEQVLAHVENCDECLAMIDEIWGDFALSDCLVTKGLTVERQAAIRVKALREVHRARLSGQFLWFGTAGFLKAVLFLIQPFLKVIEINKAENDD